VIIDDNPAVRADHANVVVAVGKRSGRSGEPGEVVDFGFGEPPEVEGARTGFPPGEFPEAF